MQFNKFSCFQKDFVENILVCEMQIFDIAKRKPACKDTWNTEMSGSWTLKRDVVRNSFKSNSIFTALLESNPFYSVI